MTGSGSDTAAGTVAAPGRPKETWAEVREIVLGWRESDEVAQRRWPVVTVYVAVL